MSLDELLSRKDELKLDLEIPQRPARRNRRSKSVSAGVNMMKRLTISVSDDHGGGSSLRRSFGANSSKDDSSLSLSQSKSSSEKQNPVKETTYAPPIRNRRQSRRESRVRGRNARSISAPVVIAGMRQSFEKDDLASTKISLAPLPPPIEEGAEDKTVKDGSILFTPPTPQRKELINNSTMRRNRSSHNSLASLVEGIPSAKVNANDIDVPLGRDSLVTFESSQDNSDLIGLPLDEVTIPQTTSGDTLQNDKRRSDEKEVKINGNNHLGDKKKTVIMNEKETKMSFLEKRIHMRNEAKKFLLSGKFEFLSFVFGTMIAFFLVGMRIEVHLISDKVIYDTKNTMHLSLEASFWLLFSWLVMFTIEGILFLALFNHSCPGKAFAGIIGGLLSATCLALLVIAESERYGGAFGSREYGGIGDIEPFVSLILLRDLRWPFGNFM